jgi:hypothetical protein
LVPHRLHFFSQHLHLFPIIVVLLSDDIEIHLITILQKNHQSSVLLSDLHILLFESSQLGISTTSIFEIVELLLHSTLFEVSLLGFEA